MTVVNSRDATVDEGALLANLDDRHDRGERPPRLLSWILAETNGQRFQHKFAKTNAAYRHCDIAGVQALHGMSAGQSAPLVLAADEPLASTFRSVNA